MKVWQKGVWIFLGTAAAVFVLSLTAAGLVAHWLKNHSESRVDQLLRSFRSGTISTDFRSYAIQIQGSGRFQFATLKEMEVFERKSTASLFWDHLQLPEVVVSLRAPVEFTYYLDLDKEWKFEFSETSIQVVIPEIEFNAPALDFSAVETRVEKGSWFRDEASVLKGLKDNLTDLLKVRAKEKIPFVRETGRRKTQEFIEWWLKNTYGSIPMTVKVQFNDEAAIRL